MDERKNGGLRDRVLYALVKLVRDVIVAGGFTIAATYAAQEWFGIDDPMELPLFATGLAVWRIVRPQVTDFLTALMDKMSGQ